MDIHQIELQVLQALGVLIGMAVLYLIKRGADWMSIKLSADSQALLQADVDKMMTLGVTRADDVIKAKGWDHVDSKNAVINYALPELQTKFSETLTKLGIDLTTSEGRAHMQDMMERMWPDIAARLSASPATPPAPTPVVAVDPSPVIVPAT